MSELNKKVKQSNKTKKTKSDTKRNRFIDMMESTHQSSHRHNKERKKASKHDIHGTIALAPTNHSPQTRTLPPQPVKAKTTQRRRKEGEREREREKQEMSEGPAMSHRGTSMETCTVPVANTPQKSDKREVEKWVGEEPARAFIDKIDSLAARTEFIEINTIQCDLQKCLMWQKNKLKNQSETFPCYDHNIVKNPNSADDYVNATSVQVPNVTRNILLGQIPRKDVGGAIEEFWKTIFAENVMLIHILIGHDEVVEFFPQVAQAYEHYGSMFVNNRKVEKTDSESVKFLMEVLPTGFSNSNMINIVMHLDWSSQNVPAKFGKTVKSVIDVINYVQSSPPDEKCMIISKYGVGRAGFFVSLCSAVSSLNNKNEPKVLNIVRAIREQRPYAVESFKQYTSIYLCLVYYIKKKLNDPKLNSKTGEINEAFKCLLEGAGTSVMQ